jgi:nuclear autoantigenic sperm protein
MKSYGDAADDLSACCALYAEIYGATADECGLAYLLYAKTLIELGQEENKVLDVPDEEDDDEDEEGAEVADGSESETNGEATPAETNGVAQTNGHHDESTTNGTAAAAVDDEQPGTSSGVTAADRADEETEEEKHVANLEVAWEVLELAVIIFKRQGETAYGHLAECYTELGGISFENSHFDNAIDDYMRALAVYENITSPNKRILAEIHYKIGLAQCIQQQFSESVEAFNRACIVIDEVIAMEKAKPEQTDGVKLNIQDLEDTKKEILAKVVEIEETKQMSIEEVKKELAKIINPTLSSSDGAGPSSSGAGSSGAASSSSTAMKPETAQSKPTDITHLIKRKKPDAVTSPEVEGSPAKRQAVDGETENQ